MAVRAMDLVGELSDDEDFLEFVDEIGDQISPLTRRNHKIVNLQTYLLTFNDKCFKYV